MRTDHHPSTAKVRAHQKGSALVIALIMLLVISFIAVGAMQGSILQERLTTSMHDRELAFQAAEAALRVAEAQVRDNDQDWRDDQGFVFAINGFNNAGGEPPNWLLSPEEDTSVDDGLSSAVAFNGVSRPPTFYIEEIDIPVGGGSTEVGVEDPGAVVFRITARGFGGTAESMVIVRGVYRTR